jgi:hypothetical protein
MAARPVARDRQAEANPAGHRNTAEFRGRHSWVEVRGDRRADGQSGVVCRGFIDCLNPETTSDHKNQTRAALGGKRTIADTRANGEVAPKAAVVVEGATPGRDSRNSGWALEPSKMLAGANQSELAAD